MSRMKEGLILLLTLAVIRADMWFPDNIKRPAKQWALLVASSNGWYNYRHQADVLHAYHTLRANGVPAENIITMLYDDIAYNKMNPKPGVIQNRPGGPNVYEGVKLDYTGKDVNVKNVFNVLTGNKEAMKGLGTSRVIESGPEDHIFVNLVDHGSTGVLIFPNEEYMYAKDLLKELRTMKMRKRFAKMVIYLEACEGGSMFDSLIEDNMGVFVVTASAPNENSYAHYCDNDINNCLGDMYSVAWMENADQLRESWSDRFVSLFKQYRHVRTAVNKSHVMVYGDFRLGFARLSEFIGDDKALPPPPLAARPRALAAPALEAPALAAPSYGDQISFPVMSRDVHVHLLRETMRKSQNETEKAEASRQLDQIRKIRLSIDETFDWIITKLAGSQSKTYLYLKYSRQSMTEEHFPCYKDVISQFHNSCFKPHENPYVMNHFYKLANICQLGIPVPQVKMVFKEACKKIDKSSKEMI